MLVRAEDGIRLIADLWVDEYPLVRAYFGEHLARLLRAMQNGSCYTHFAKVALRPWLLEARLKRIEDVGQTRVIMDEVGDIDDLEKLDERLYGAWAELRVVDQLRKEGFDSIQKVEETADLTARKDGQAFAFQVTCINKSWRDQIPIACDSDSVVSLYGDIEAIYSGLSPQLLSRSKTCESEGEYGPLSYYFWDAIENKNCDLKEWKIEDRRCLVVVSNEEELQDSMARHVACRLICKMLHDWLLAIHFEEMLRLPDAGNGAWFKVGDTIGETRCFADWGDKPESDKTSVCRREVDLSSDIPDWKAR